MRGSSRIRLVASAASVIRAAARPGGPTVGERVRSVPRLVRATLNGTYLGTSRRRLALVAAAVAYVASPIDLLPEAVLPVLGAADDAVVVSWAIKVLVEETDRFLAWELGHGVAHRAGKPEAQSRGAATGVATSYVLEAVRKRIER